VTPGTPTTQTAGTTETAGTTQTAATTEITGTTEIATDTIAVVVVTFNSERHIPDLIASLEPGLRGLSWHLTVADNDSADNTLAVLSEHAPYARVVRTGRNAGYAAGINAAVAAAGAHTAVLVLNPDIRLAPQCVPELVAVLRRSRAGIVVPRILLGDGGFSPSLRRDPTIPRALGDALFGARRMGRFPWFGEVVSDERRYGDEQNVDWAEGSIMLIDRACWQACGSWDESFFLYSEETEYALRARDHGFAMVYTPRAQARHLEGGSATSPRLWTLVTLNRVRLYRRRHRLAGSVAFWAVLLLRESSRALLGNPCSRSAVRALLSTARLREVPGPASVHPASAQPTGTQPTG